MTEIINAFGNLEMFAQWMLTIMILGLPMLIIWGIVSITRAITGNYPKGGSIL